MTNQQNLVDGPIAEGVLSPCYTLVFEREFSHAPSRVWRAIVDPDEASQWIGGRVSFDLRRGGLARFEGVVDDEIVTEVNHEHALMFSWKWSMVRLELEGLDGGARTRFRFIHHGLDRESVAIGAGWQPSIEHLEALLEGRTFSVADAKKLEDALVPQYVAMTR
jgi:uncharacterized protein YndB with AHSA1/START domain